MFDLLMVTLAHHLVCAEMEVKQCPAVKFEELEHMSAMWVYDPVQPYVVYPSDGNVTIGYIRHEIAHQLEHENGGYGFKEFCHKYEGAGCHEHDFDDYT